MTDGRDGNHNFGVDGAIVKAKNNKISINTVSLGNSIDEDILKKIANETGGKYYHASVALDLADATKDFIVDTIDTTTDSNKDGITDYHMDLIYQGKMPGAELLKGYDFNSYGDDFDDDGLKNGEEIKIITNDEGYVYAQLISDPRICDSDFDGFSGGEELLMRSNPFICDRRIDQIDYFLDYNEEFIYTSKLYDIASSLLPNIEERRYVYINTLVNYFSSDSNKVCNSQGILNEKRELCDIIFQIIENTQKFDDVDKIAKTVQVSQDILNKMDEVSAYRDVLNMISTHTGKINKTIDHVFDVGFYAKVIIDYTTMTNDLLKNICVLRSSNMLMKQNVKIIDNLIEYCDKNKYSDMKTAANTIRNTLENNYLPLISNVVDQMISSDGTDLVLKITGKAPDSLLIKSILVVAESLVDQGNYHRFYGKTFNKLLYMNIGDKHKEQNEHTAYSILVNANNDLVKSYANKKNSYYEFSNGSNEIAMNSSCCIQTISYLVQSELLCKKNLYSNNKEFKIQNARILIDEMKLPIDDNLYDSSIQNTYLVPSK